MQLVNDFVKNTLPASDDMQFWTTLKAFICIVGAFIALVMLENIIEEHKKSRKSIAIVIMIAASVAIGGYNTFTTCKNMTNKYNMQVSQIAEKYPYSIVVNPDGNDGNKSALILEKTKPSKAYLEKIKQGKELETNNDHIIIYTSIDNDGNAIETSILNHYSLNQYDTKVIYDKTGNRDPILFNN